MNPENREWSSGHGSGEPVLEEKTTSFMILDDWNATVGNFSHFDARTATASFSTSAYPEILDSSMYKYGLYIGGGLSIFSCLIALFTYASSRKFRIKRPHMITINLCISLLIFYVGIITSVSNSSPVVTFDNGYGPCVAAAVLLHVGILFSWTWITAHWTYLAYTVHKASASHISHFAIKITLPAYGIPSLFTGALLIANAAAEPGYYVSKKTCMFKLNLITTAVLNFLYLAICFGIVASCVTYCVCRLTCKRDKHQVESTRMRIKVSVTRLAVITIGVMIISMLELARSGLVVRKSTGWFEILNGAILGVAGISVSVGLALRSKEFRLYLVRRSQSAATMRRLVSTFRRKARRDKRNPDENGKRFRNIKSKLPAPILYDEVRPPKPIPREDVSRHPRPHSKLAPLAMFLNSALRPRHTNESPEVQEYLDDVVFKEPKPVDNSAAPKRRQRFGSLRQKASQLKSTKSTRTQSVKLRSNPSVRAPLPAPRRMGAEPESTQRISLSSLDFCKKSSF